MLAGIDLAVSQRTGNGLDHRLGRMPENRRPVAQDIVDMDVAIDVIEPRPLAALEEQRHRRAGVAHVAADATREVGPGPFVELDRLGVAAHGPHPARTVPMSTSFVAGASVITNKSKS